MLNLKAYLTSGGKYPKFEKDFYALPEDLVERYTKRAMMTIARASLICDQAGVKNPICTSGYRPKSHHLAIYAALGRPAPMGSKHLTCEAIDLADPKKLIGQWALANIEFLEENDIWMESLVVTHRAEKPSGLWIHTQIVAPGSGNRVFMP